MNYTQLFDFRIKYCVSKALIFDMWGWFKWEILDEILRCNLFSYALNVQGIIFLKYLKPKINNCLSYSVNDYKRICYNFQHVKRKYSISLSLF